MFREITAADLPALPALLREGFPTTAPGFWETALGVLDRRDPVAGMPRYGVVLEKDGALGGVMLMISQERDGARFCNLSSWYVREAHRGMAPFMFAHVLKTEGVTYLDCSPTPEVVPIVEKYGFVPYTGGSLLIDLRAALRRGPPVRPLTPVALEACAGFDRLKITKNMAVGCRGLLAEGRDGVAHPLVYRIARVKRHIPVARFVHGAPERIVEHAGAIARHLVARGVPLALVDWPTGRTAPFGRMMAEYGVRYRRGDVTPPLGDLLDTEYALFGI